MATTTQIIKRPGGSFPSRTSLPEQIQGKSATARLGPQAPPPNANLDYLLRELAAARAENRTLRSRLPKRSRYSAIVQRAVVDGHTLVLRAFAGEATSRVAMLDEGMSARRWQWGVAFLRYAGVLGVGGDWRYGLRWQVDLLDECVRLIETSAGELAGAAGYKRLRALAKRR